MSKHPAIQASHNQTTSTRNVCANVERTAVPDLFSKHVCVQRDSTRLDVEENAPALVRKVLDSPGTPLERGIRSSMEHRFGFDFSNVRVHADDRAAESARAVNANAYTAGNHIAFAFNKYSPSTLSGQNLLAHELTHVVQQASEPVSGSKVAGGLSVSHPQDRLERYANQAARSLAEIDGKAPRDPLPELPVIGTSRETVIQRQGEGPFTQAGGIAGIAGAVFGLGSLAVALNPPNPQPTTGGIAIDHVAINTLDRQAGGSTDESLEKAAGESPRSTKVLEMRASKDDIASVNLLTQADDHNIIDAHTEEGEVKGFAGGSGEGNASVKFTATQTKPLSAKKSGAEKSEETKVDKAEVSVRYQGVVSSAPGLFGRLVRSSGDMLRFSGSFRVDGTGKVSENRPRKIGGSKNGQVDTSGDGAAVVGFDLHSGSNSGSLLITPGPERKGFDFPELPFNKPWTGGSE